jgi:hypothetical protein
MISLADPLEPAWTNGPAAVGGGQHPRASRYRYQYAVHTVTRLIIAILLGNLFGA